MQPSPPSLPAQTQRSAITLLAPHFTCPSTLDAYPQDQFDACPCRHFFSKEALTSALAAAMTEPLKAQLTRCLAAQTHSTDPPHFCHHPSPYLQNFAPSPAPLRPPPPHYPPFLSTLFCQRHAY